jgi:hypothetical protein
VIVNPTKCIFRVLVNGIQSKILFRGQ